MLAVTICSRYKVSKWSSCQEPQQIRWGVRCGWVWVWVAGVGVKGDSQIMMVRMVTFLEVRWVARNGGLSRSLIENGSSLRTKPASSLYLKQNKQTKKKHSGLHLIRHSCLTKSFAVEHTHVKCLKQTFYLFMKKKKRLILNLIAATPQDSGQCPVYNGTQL